MNKNIFRSRTVIGAVCILLAVLVCFGITPLFNEGLKAQTEAVRVKAEVIPRGDIHHGGHGGGLHQRGLRHGGQYRHLAG